MEIIRFENRNKRAKSLEDNLLELSYTDNANKQADTLSFSISNSENFTPPVAKTELNFYLSGVFKGVFELGYPTFSGYPEKITLHATSVFFGEATDPLRSGISLEERLVSYTDHSIYSIVSQIAAANKLGANISPIYKSAKLKYKIQRTDDLNFLYELAVENNAIVNVKNNTLIFLAPGKINQSQETFILSKSNLGNYELSFENRESVVSSVVAKYKDNNIKDLRAGDISNVKQGESVIEIPLVPNTTSGGKKVLHKIFANKEDAMQAASSVAAKLATKKQKLELTNLINTPVGLTSGSRFRFKEDFLSLSADWTIESMTYNYSAMNGLSVDMTCQVST